MAKATPSAPPTPRPKRAHHPSSKVVDPANAAEAGLSIHRLAVEARRIAEVAASATGQDTTESTPEPETRSSAPTPPVTVASSPEPHANAKRANPATADVDDDSEEDNRELPRRLL